MVNKNTTCISASELIAKNLKISSKEFWHYTKLKSLKDILDSKCFRFRPISGTNDRDEADLHGEDGKYTYTFCFCCNSTEKISMWYLYGGIDGKGVGICLKQNVMKSILASIEKVKTSVGSYLQKGSDFDIECGYVYYQKGDLENCTYKYRRKNYTLCSSDEYYEFAEDNYFIKKDPWDYENEFRIVIKTKDRTEYEYLDLEIPDVLLSELSFCFAPEMSEEEIHMAISNSEILQSYLSHGNWSRSKLNVKMHLLDRSRLDLHSIFFDDFNEIFNEKKDLEKICGIIKNNNACQNDLRLATV